MTRSFALAAVLVSFSSVAVVAQSSELWVGTDAVDARRIWPGTSVTTHTMVENGETEPGYVQTEQVAFIVRDGRRLLRQTVAIERNGRTAVTDTTLYDAATLAPVSHVSHAPGRRTLQLHYWGNEVGGTMTPAEGEPEDIRVSLEQGAYDPSSYLLLVRALPLEEGYGVKLPVFSHEAREKHVMHVWVNGIESVQTGEDTWEDAYAVSITYEGSDARSTYWVAKDSRLMLKSEASWREGQVVTGWTKFTAEETDQP